jgi:6-pyruvoyltetrahydropterin/6-carboxytetrahydropterin synthase
VSGEVHFHRVFSAAHRLWSDSSKCQNIHGHNYHVQIIIKGPVGAESGMVVPFDWIKEVIDRYDHSLVLAEGDPELHELGAVTRVVTTRGLPTTENLAQEIAFAIADLFPASGKEWKVVIRLAETDNISAYARATSTEVQDLGDLRTHDPG